MTDIVRLKDPDGRIHYTARDSKTVVDGLASGWSELDDDNRPLDLADTTVEPPRGGAGSGVDVWREYAIHQGVAVSEGMTRDEIVIAVDASKEATGEAETAESGDDPDTEPADEEPGQR